MACKVFAMTNEKTKPKSPALRVELLRGLLKYVELYTKHRGSPSVAEMKVIESAFEAGAKWGAVATAAVSIEHDLLPTEAARRVVKASS